MSKDQMPSPGQIYKDNKNQPLQIVASAQHGVTGEPFVVYQTLYGDFKTYVLPQDQFECLINEVKHPADEQTKEEVIRKDTLIDSYERQDPDKHYANNKTESEEHVSVKLVEDIPEKAADHFLDNTEDKNSEGQGAVNPLLMQFLDAETYAAKCEVLEYIKKKLNDKLIENLAISIDVVLNEGSVEDRFEELRTCLETFAKFENVRRL